MDELIDDIRTDTGSSYPAGNAGAAVTEIDGVTSEVKSFSKINNTTSDTSKLNHDYSYKFDDTNRIFDTQKVDTDNVVNGPRAFDRAVDTEAKILEDIAHQLGYNTKAVDSSVTGKVYLITERAPCASCADVISQFNEMFPNIEVIVKNKY